MGFTCLKFRSQAGGVLEDVLAGSDRLWAVTKVLYLLFCLFPQAGHLQASAWGAHGMTASTDAVQQLMQNSVRKKTLGTI